MTMYAMQDFAEPELPESPAEFGEFPVQAAPTGADDYGREVGIPPPDPDYNRFKPIDRENIKGLTGDRLNALGRFFKQYIEEATSARAMGGRDDNIKRFRELYEGGDTDKPSWSYGCVLTPPDARVAVDTVVSRLLDILTANEEYVTVSSPLPEDEEAVRKCVQYAMGQFGMGGPIKHVSKLGRGLRNMKIDCAALVRAFWRTEKRKVRRRVTITPEFLLQQGVTPPSDPESFPKVRLNGKDYLIGDTILWEEERTVASHFDYEMKDVRDYFQWPAHAKSVEDAVIAGYFSYETPDELRQNAEEGYYDKRVVLDLVGKAPAFDGVFEGSSSSSFTMGTIEAPNDGPIGEQSDGISRSHEQMSAKFGRRRIAHFYARVYDADGDGRYEDLYYCMEWSTGKLLRVSLPDTDDGCRNLYLLQDDPRVGDGIYGYSLMERLADLQEELTAITRIGVDLGIISTISIIEQDPGRRRMKDKGLHPGPNYVDTAEDGRIVKVHAMPDVPVSNLRDRGEISGQIERASGAAEVLQGSVPTGETTLGETNLAVGGANTRLKYNLVYLLDGLTWLYQRFFALSRQNIEDNLAYSVIVNGTLIQDQITPADLAVTEYATVAAYSRNMDPSAALEFQRGQQAFQAMANSPFVQGNFERMGLVLTDFLKNVLKVPYDLAPRIGTPEEWRNMNQAQAQAQQMQQAMGGMMGGLNGPPMEGEEVA